jgi:hypothetical protein
MYPRCAGAAACTIAFAVSRTHMCTPRATPSPSDLPSSLKRTWTPRTCFSHARARGTRPPHPAAWSQPVIEWWWMEVTYGLPRSTVASAASLDPSAKNLGTPAGRPRSDTADRTVCARGPRKLTNGGPERGR